MTGYMLWFPGLYVSPSKVNKLCGPAASLFFRSNLLLVYTMLPMPIRFSVALDGEWWCASLMTRCLCKSGEARCKGKGSLSVLHSVTEIFTMSS
jgi:hypothetical protein